MINPLKQVIGFQTFGRIRLYIDSIEDVYSPTKVQKEMAEPLKRHLSVTLVKASIASGIRNFFYFIIYASVITAFFTAFTAQVDLSFVNTSIKLVSGIIGGTAVSVVMAFIFDRMKNLYFIDMMLLASTITSIYASPEKTNLEFEKLILGTMKIKSTHHSKSAKSK